jgi:hypothetical protein
MVQQGETISSKYIQIDPGHGETNSYPVLAQNLVKKVQIGSNDITAHVFGESY